MAVIAVVFRGLRIEVVVLVLAAAVLHDDPAGTHASVMIEVVGLRSDDGDLVFKHHPVIWSFGRIKVVPCAVDHGPGDLHRPGIPEVIGGPVGIGVETGQHASARIEAIVVILPEEPGVRHILTGHGTEVPAATALIPAAAERALGLCAAVRRIAVHRIGRVVSRTERIRSGRDPASGAEVDPREGARVPGVCIVHRIGGAGIIQVDASARTARTDHRVRTAGAVEVCDVLILVLIQDIRAIRILTGA